MQQTNHKTGPVKTRRDQKWRGLFLQLAVLVPLLAFLHPARSSAQGLDGKIVFARSFFLGPGSSTAHIYVMNPDGTNVTQLTTSPEVDTAPSFSGDGKRIAFATVTQGPPVLSEIYVINSDGTNETRLTTGDFDLTPSFSRDGTRIVFNRLGQIYVINADGSGLTQLTTDQFRSNRFPSFSPDGRSIAFSSARDFGGNTSEDVIYVMNADGSNPTRLTDGPFDREPTFSPDGARIVFASARGGSGHQSNIWVMNANGINQTQLTTTTAGADNTPSFSPDGTHIAFISDRDPNPPPGMGFDNEIYVMRADGTEQTRLTDNVDQDTGPCWGSPPPTGDLLIKFGNEPYAGDNIYQTVAAGPQLRNDELTPSAALKYAIKLQNEAGRQAAFRLRTQAPLANAGWGFRLLLFPELTDISAAARSSDGWLSPTLAPDEELVVILEAQPDTADADEAAQLRILLSADEAPETVLDALGINIERGNIIVVNDSGDADDPTPEDGSPDTDPSRDGAQITLRSAINFSNRKPGRDAIAFAIPGASIPLISPRSALPPITAPTVLAGESSSGGKVELDGTAAGAVDGLTIQAQDCIVRGFVIHSFGQSGLEIAGAGSNSVEGCFIGVDVTGKVQRANKRHGIHVISAQNLIGGPSSQLGLAPGNVISGNGDAGWGSGVVLEGAQANENIVQGNLIGTDVTGQVALGSEVAGVVVQNGSRNQIGGTLATERNIISGNKKGGVFVRGSTAKSNLVLGNFIGTNIGGTAAIPTEKAGIALQDETSDNFIGGVIAGAGNVIAGVQVDQDPQFAASGIAIDQANNNRIQGNYIGTDATGRTPLPNPFGITLGGGQGNLIGGTVPGAGNVISGNRTAGVLVNNYRHPESLGGDAVIGNLIGTDQTGTRALPNGTSPQVPLAAGILVGNYKGPLFVGGSDSSRRNIISGNRGAGLLFGGNSGFPSFIAGNYIGTQVDGTTALPNAGPGISVLDQSNVKIGGTDLPGLGNRIAFNRGSGVLLLKGVRNEIGGNSIFGNTGLGIAFKQDGSPTLNDPADADEGPNRRQNFPVIESLEPGPGGIEILGQLDSRGAEGESFLLAFYSNRGLDPSGFGEGETFLGSALVPANPGGAIAFDVSISSPNRPGTFLTATARDKDGNTSEFSGLFLMQGSTQTDTDGISDEIEDQVPNGTTPRGARTQSAHGFGDGNGDGVRDALQNNVASFPAITGNWLTLVAPDGIPLANVRPVGPLAMSNLPAGYSFPEGLTAFTARDVVPGGSFSSTLIFHDGFRPSTVFAYGPTPDNTRPHWYEFLYDGTTGVEFADGAMILHFVDGTRGDHDLQVNGQITTLLGPAARSTQVSPLLNISTRSRVLTGDRVIIGGLIITGSEPKIVILRALGNSLNVNGVPIEGRLRDPTLTLYNEAGEEIAFNDDYVSLPGLSAPDQIASTGLQPEDPKESAIVQTLDPGAYTAVVRGKNDTTGISLIEIYDLNPEGGSQLANLSTRAFVDTTDNLMIGGAIVAAPGMRVMVRGIGPSLSVNGVPVAERLADPTLQLVNEDGVVVAENDDWQSDQAAEIEATGLAPVDPAESAILANLPAGPTTMLLRGRSGTTGIGLLEIYAIPPSGEAKTPAAPTRPTP